jgi:seryl-tRNA synthetase
MAELFNVEDKQKRLEAMFDEEFKLEKERQRRQKEIDDLEAEVNKVNKKTMIEKILSVEING